MKELKVISLENGVILSENLVKGSILPRTSLLNWKGMC